MGHGFVQVPIHREADQREMIFRTAAAIRDFTGAPCAGWLGPGLTETLETPDRLAEAGIRYIADWVVDDLPCRLATAHGTILTMPYTVEMNDIPVQMIQHHAGGELEARARRTADRLVREAKAGAGAKVMSLAIHPYITGVPHRIDAFEALLDDLLARGDVAFMQGRTIRDWYLAGSDDT